MRKGKENCHKHTLSEESACPVSWYFASWARKPRKAWGTIMCLLLFPVGSASLTVSTVFNTMCNWYFLEDKTQRLDCFEGASRLKQDGLKVQKVLGCSNGSPRFSDLVVLAEIGYSPIRNISIDTKWTCLSVSVGRAEHVWVGWRKGGSA